MKEEVIIRILDKASAFMERSSILRLKLILEDELQHVMITPECTDLAVRNNLQNKIGLFLAAKKIDGLSPKTLKNYYLVLNKMSHSVSKNVDEITDIDLRLYLARYSQTGIKNSTLATAVTALKAFFSWCAAQDYVRKNPMWNIKQPKVEKRLRKPLSDDELELLRNVCATDREKAVVEFFYSTGCRLDEVYKLNRDDINWYNKSCMVIGKGNKEREVYISARSALFLKNYLEARRDSNPALFVGVRQPHLRLSGRAIEDIFGELGTRAGIKRKIHPHLMRHTMATNLLRNGASMSAVQGLLGHEDPATTQIYAQLDKDELHNIHRKNIA